jgi:large subunit ribosomal protein L20
MRARNKVASRARRKKLIKSAKGYFLKRSKNIRRVKETRRRALVYAYRDRRAKKREFRSLWITRIGAAAKEHGLSYRDLIHRLKLKNVILSRDILAKIAAEEPRVFDKIIETIK